MSALKEWPSIAEIAAAVQAGEVTAVGQLERAIAAHEAYADKHSMLSLNEQAKEQAEAIDARVAAGEQIGALAGVPFVVKDNFLVTGTTSTAASNILGEFVAPYTATSVQRLVDQGAVLLGKANLDSFGHGSSTENSDFGPTKHPLSDEHVAGGSSGGPAAAVALGIVPFGLGTDTGGSIRQPASFCGVTGLKPTYGLVSRYGVVAMASSTDTIGPIAKTAEDAAIVLEHMSGKDTHDSTTIDRISEDYSSVAAKDVSGLKIGLISDYMTDGVAPEIKQAVSAAANQLKEAGASIEEVSMPNLDLALAVYYIVMPAEVSSNLSRYDGIRYGLSDNSANSLDEVYDNSRSQGFNDENKRRIMIGTYVLSSGYYDAYYKKAQTVRTRLIADFAEAFKKYDVLIGPVAPNTTFKFGDNTDDPMQMYLQDVMTVAASLAGIPSVSAPLPVDGMPIGLQVLGPQGGDGVILSIAKEVQSPITQAQVEAA